MIASTVVPRIPSSSAARFHQREDRLFLDALLISFGVIFVAELGDKSQLMALAFATRYRALPVLAGITGATAVVHLVSVVVGALLGAALPARPVNLLAGLAFLAFAAWTLRGDAHRRRRLLRRLGALLLVEAARG
jgi:putative Ca2+/H+ antiporter (TMEM165/GDT1 family)